MKSSGAPVPPVAAFFPCAQCVQKLPQKCLALADATGSRIDTRRVRAADLCLRQHLAHRRGRHIVEPVVLLRGAVPVADVRLVPHLPQPAIHRRSVAILQVRRIGFDQRAPLRVVLRRIAPAGKEIALGKVVPIRLRMRRQRLRHEAQLHNRAHVRIAHGVEDAVRDRPVVDRRAVCALRVHIGRAPLQRAVAIARREQVVCAEVHRRVRAAAQLAQLLQQLPSMRTIDIVRLIRAKVAPDGRERAAHRSIGMHRHTNGRSILTACRKQSEKQQKAQKKTRRKGSPAHAATLNDARRSA